MQRWRGGVADNFKKCDGCSPREGEDGEAEPAGDLLWEREGPIGKQVLFVWGGGTVVIIF